MNQEVLEMLESLSLDLGSNIRKASIVAQDMEPTDAKYDKLVKDIEVLTRAYDQVTAKYNELKNPKVDYDALPWWKKLDVTKLIIMGLTILASIGTNFCIIKWEKDGYLIGRNAAKINIPRPY